MEVLLGYLLGLGTVVTLARRGTDARSAVAWTARHVGALSGKVSQALDQAASIAREEYEKGRVNELKSPRAEGLGIEVGAGPHTPAEHANGASIAAVDDGGYAPKPPASRHLNGN